MNNYAESISVISVY